MTQAISNRRSRVDADYLALKEDYTARAAEVLRVWSVWSLDAPDEVTTSWRVLNVPPIEEMPPPFRGRTIVVIDGAVLADDERAVEAAGAE